MILYIGLTVVTIALAFFINSTITVQPNRVSRQQLVNRILLVCIFLLLTSVSAFRTGVGNDYGEYLEIFQAVHEGRHVSTEPGFNLVVKAVQFFFGAGRASSLIIFAVFAFATVYFMLRAVYEQSEWFVYSFFLLMVQGYYFNSMTTVRYYFVLSVALYAMKYVKEKKWCSFVLWIVFAAFFHKSVLFVIPVYFLAQVNWKRWHIFLASGVCVTFMLFQEQYRRIIFHFYPYYENSQFDNGQTSLINIAKCAGVLVLSLLYYKQAVKDSKENRFYFYLNLGSLILYVFCSFIPEISRVGFYMNVSNIFLVPSVIKSIPEKRHKWFLGTVITVAFCLYFAVFLRGAYQEGIRLLPYKSFLVE